MKVKFKKLGEDAVVPSYAHTGDAGLDLTATSFTQELDKSGKLVLVYHTNLAVEIPEGYFGLLCMRSSVKDKSLTLCNGVGIIDSTFRGELVGKFKITTDAIPTIYQAGDKFAQLLILPIPTIEPEEATELSETERGEGGFGSSDNKEEKAA
jgi:dUTP pyrophosphatase